jgi:hypothetical protein
MQVGHVLNQWHQQERAEITSACGAIIIIYTLDTSVT